MKVTWICMWSNQVSRRLSESLNIRCVVVRNKDPTECFFSLNRSSIRTFSIWEEYIYILKIIIIKLHIMFNLLGLLSLLLLLYWTHYLIYRWQKKQLGQFGFLRSPSNNSNDGRFPTEEMNLHFTNKKRVVAFKT